MTARLCTSYVPCPVVPVVAALVMAASLTQGQLLLLMR